MSYSKFSLIVALPLVLMSTMSQAASSKDKQQSTYAAREKCFQEAAAAYPGTTDSPGVMSGRTATYMACAKKAGFKP